MIAFVLSAAAMLATILALVLRPLLAHGAAPAGEAAEGEAAEGATSRAGTGPLRGQAALVSLLVVAVSASLYFAIGTPRGLQPEASQAQAPLVGPDQIQTMVARLAARLKEQPADAAGWRMLARSYETLRRFDDAANAYRQLIKLEGESADLLVDYAVVLGMSNGQHLTGEPQRMLERALALDGNHVQAWALLGSAALETGDRAGAVKAWKRILALVPEDSEIGRSITASIANAQAQAPKPSR